MCVPLLPTKISAKLLSTVKTIKRQCTKLPMFVKLQLVCLFRASVSFKLNILKNCKLSHLALDSIGGYCLILGRR